MEKMNRREGIQKNNVETKWMVENEYQKTNQQQNTVRNWMVEKECTKKQQKHRTKMNGREGMQKTIIKRTGMAEKECNPPKKKNPTKHRKKWMVEKEGKKKSTKS